MPTVLGEVETVRGDVHIRVADCGLTRAGSWIGSRDVSRDGSAGLLGLIGDRPADRLSSVDDIYIFVDSFRSSRRVSSSDRLPLTGDGEAAIITPGERRRSSVDLGLAPNVDDDGEVPADRNCWPVASSALGKPSAS
jgi:hypothetical protein